MSHKLKKKNFEKDLIKRMKSQFTYLEKILQTISLKSGNKSTT